MTDLDARLRSVAGDRAAAWLDDAKRRLTESGAGVLPVLFPALARTVGRAPLGGGVQVYGDLTVDLDAWRACDAAGSILMRAADASGETIADLFLHGDYEERTIAMRSLALLEIRPVTTQLLAEAQRTNMQLHFEACVCDSNLVARAVGKHGFTAGLAYRVLLKAAFVDLPLARFFDILDHASPELSRMVTGLATEREAAGRDVWADTNRVIAKAPIAGTVERVAAGLEHTDERHRLASADALPDLDEPELWTLAAARLERETSPNVRAALERALGARDGQS